MAEKKCLTCGKPLPPNTFATRKYCYECHLNRVTASRKRAAEKRREKEKAEKDKPQPVYIQRRTPKPNDEKYCQKCKYHGKAGVNLCDYFLRTGERRGCHAGYGCTKFKKEE